MPEWMYEKRDFRTTPSIKDGISFEDEAKFRREGARLIIDVGADLNLRFDTVATGCVYYHRFFMRHSFKEFNKHVTAIGCMFLAGKVEETPKKCRDLLRVAKPRLTEQQFLAFGDDPREEVMVIERVLLQTIKFDLQVDHPYQFLIKYAKILQGDKTGIENLVQMAWTFINDSLCTTICLQWEPEIVAIALMYLASRLSKCEISDWKNRKNLDGEKWWDQFVEDLNLDTLEDICHQVLDLYSHSGGGGQQMPSATSRPSNAPPVFSPATPTMNSNGSCGASAATPSTMATPTASFGPAPSLPTSNNNTPSSSSNGISGPQPPLVRRDSTKLTASAMHSLQSSSSMSTSLSIGSTTGAPSADVATRLQHSSTFPRQRASLDGFANTTTPSTMTTTTHAPPMMTSSSIDAQAAEALGSDNCYYYDLDGYYSNPAVHGNSISYGASTAYSNPAASYNTPLTNYSNPANVYSNPVANSYYSRPTIANDLTGSAPTTPLGRPAPFGGQSRGGGSGYRNLHSGRQQGMQNLQKQRPYGRAYPRGYD